MASLTDFLASQPLFKVVGALLGSSEPRHLRDLAKEQKLSPSGVSDILRRLKNAGFLKDKKQGNRRYVSLSLSSEERKALLAIFQNEECLRLRKRALQYSQGAPEKFKWMDEAYKFYRNIKK